jgi:drug/metabolite transporter (DMT)-like permease
VPALRVVLISYPTSMLMLAVLAAVVGGDVSAPAVYWGLLSGLCSAVGVWWFYAALAAGPISVVSPLTAILVAGVPVGVGVALGERPSPIAITGIVLALAAVFLVSREVTDEDVTPHRFTRKVAWLTVGSGVAFGLTFVLIAPAPAAAGLWPLVFARISATLLVVLVAAVTRELRPPSGRPFKLALAAATLDTIANVAMLAALHSSLLSLAAVLISLYPAATVLLAIVVLKERVTRWQLVGMALALGAVAMIAAG